MKWQDGYELGSGCRITHGYPFKSSQMTTDAIDAPVVVNIGNFRYDGGFRFSSTKIQRFTGEVPADYVLAPGDILLVMTCQTSGGEILGIPGRIPGDETKYLHNQRLGKLVVTDPEALDPKFIYYLFLSASFNRHLYATSTGSKILHTAPKRIEAYRFARPPLLTQRRIAGILTAYDDLIENNTKRIEILEEMARALYREWFVHFRFPGHEKVKLVDSPLGQIPEGWNLAAIGDVTENFDRMRRPLSKMQRAEMQGQYPYYGAAKIFDYINDYIFDGRYLLSAEDGSVITTDRRPVLQIATGKFWVNNHTHILRGRDPYSTDFIYLRLNELDISPYITGAAQPKITQENLNRIPVVTPPGDLLAKFDQLVGPMLALVDNLRGRCSILIKIRDLLLPRLISGEVDVDSLNLPEIP